MDLTTIDRLYQVSLDYLYEKTDFLTMHNLFDDYAKISREERKEYDQIIIQKFSGILDACKGTEWYYYYCSFLIYVTGSNELAQELIRKSCEDSFIDEGYKYHIWSHIGVLNFLGILAKDQTTYDMLDDLYDMSYQEYMVDCGFEYRYIPESERNQDLIIVMTTQVLHMEHGPTKTLLDRCYILTKCLKKKVFIINTAEGVIETTKIPIFGMKMLNYLDEYNTEEYLQYKDCKFPFYQCPKNMPESNVIHEILDVVASEKPLCIVLIGGGSIVADLCSKLVPTIAVSLVPSGRTQTYGQFQAVGYHVTEEDYRWAEKHGRLKDHFIESVFTSAFKPQQHTYSREELGLPQDGFIIILIGGRLDYEVDDTCLELLLKLMNQGLYVAFMGIFNRFDTLSESVPVFRDQAINLGFQEDALAVLECVDLYLNPKRVGGGTSVAEALYKKIPVVTMNYGDGGLGAGEDFWLDDYDEMYNAVLRYSTDPVFYKEKQQQASSRATVLMDSEGQFTKIMQTAMEREAFH